MGVVGEGDQEAIGVGSDAERKGIHPGKLVVAVSDFGLSCQPGDCGVESILGLCDPRINGFRHPTLFCNGYISSA